MMLRIKSRSMPRLQCPTIRRIRSFALAALLVGMSLAPRVHADEEPAWLDTGDDVRTLRVVDLDQDGRDDLIAASKTDLRVWLGSASGLSRAATSRKALNPSLSYVDANAATGAIYALGGTTLTTYRMDAKERSVSVREAEAQALDWMPTDGFALTRLALGRGVLIPRDDGWAWLRPNAKVQLLKLEPKRELSAAGPFMEDDTEFTVSWPEVVLGAAPARDASAEAQTTLWALDEDTLVGDSGARRTTYDLAFLSAAGRRSLVDLNADGRPDLVHQGGTNREGQLAFFVTALTKDARAAKGPSHAPARGFLRFSGFALEPEFVDLDGDGRLDLVLTTIEVNGRNMIRAITSGRVTAMTRAFRNRSADQPAPFSETPDTTITSEVGVRLRFSYAGTIQVERSLTIVSTGDYDGDGLRDLALRTGPTTLRVHRGTPGATWAKDGKDYSVPSTAAVDTVDGYPLDADGDGKDELALLYYGADGAADRVLVVKPR